jgi:hypothetical protein
MVVEAPPSIAVDSAQVTVVLDKRVDVLVILRKIRPGDFEVVTPLESRGGQI